MEPTVSFEPLPQLVLQCCGCKTILGDTHDFICTATVGSAKLVVLAACTDVTVDTIPQPTTVAGATCNHFPVCCSACGGVTGRMYTRPPPELEALCNAFAMDAARCISYQLGSADVRVAGAAAALPAAAAAAASNLHEPLHPALPPAGAAGGDLVTRVEALEAELLKMQGMILLHDTQLHALPGYPNVGGGGEGFENGGGGGMEHDSHPQMQFASLTQ